MTPAPANASIAIRRARPDDVREWHRLRQALWPRVAADELAREADRLLQAPRHATFVAARPAGTLVGFLEISLRDHAEGCATSPVGYIEGWYVEPPARRRQVGRELVVAAEAWAREHGCAEMASDSTLDDVDGQAAHRALGYREVERAVHFRKSLGKPATELPNVAAALAEVMQRVPVEQQPLLVAIAERMAAERYRRWAAVVEDDHRAGLLACAEREDEIARRVEALYPSAALTQREILDRHPDLPELNRSLFAELDLDEQFALQARGERLGAATWRAFARREADPDRRETLLGCAALEEENARFLEAIGT